MCHEYHVVVLLHVTVELRITPMNIYRLLLLYTQEPRVIQQSQKIFLLDCVWIQT